MTASTRDTWKHRPVIEALPEEPVHHYPLHQRVMVDCPCCLLSNETIFTSSHEQVICNACKVHIGDGPGKAVRRDRDHVNLWHSEFTLALERHDEEMSRLRAEVATRDETIEELRGEVEELRQAVRDGIGAAELPAVERWWADERVAAAHTERDRAYKSRSHVYRVLWALTELHHESLHSDRCSCGKQRNGCKELAKVRRVEGGLRKWERNEIERMERGEPHGLPDEHPEVLKQGPGYRRPSWPDWEADAG